VSRAQQHGADVDEGVCGPDDPQEREVEQRPDEDKYPKGLFPYPFAGSFNEEDDSQEAEGDFEPGAVRACGDQYVGDKGYGCKDAEYDTLSHDISPDL